MNEQENLKLSKWSQAGKQIDDYETRHESDQPYQFGVRYLDDALVGISKSDLVLIGAKSGSGKTELVSTIALTNAAAGKKVTMFALEAEEGEITDRLLFRRLSEKYFSKRKQHDFTEIAYDLWKAGRLKNQLDIYRDEVNEKLKEDLKNLTIRYSNASYTVEDYEKEIEECVAKKEELIIIDHLHYFDIDETKALSELKKICMKIRDIALRVQIPVVLVSHMRKSDRYDASIVPSLEDFHGSSDVFKIATKAIVIGQCRCDFGFYTERQNEKGGGKFWECEPLDPLEGFPTLIRIVKNRRQSSVTNFIALTWFNPKTNSYADRYYLGHEQYIGQRVFNALKLYPSGFQRYKGFMGASQVVLKLKESANKHTV